MTEEKNQEEKVNITLETRGFLELSEELNDFTYRFLVPVGSQIQDAVIALSHFNEYVKAQVAEAEKAQAAKKAKETEEAEPKSAEDSEGE